MLFNSIDFLFFFPLVVLVYFLMPFRLRWLFLLAASYFFYMYWNKNFLLLILLSTAIDYFTGKQMGKLPDKKARKPYLMISLVSNLGILCAFKYFNFFNDSFRELFELLHLSYAIPALSIVLPVGISFYTFQTLAYSIDVYRGKIQAEQHVGYFALYVSYFPQLVAGPIERSSNLIPQFKHHFRFDYQRTTDGLKLMAWGLFKKVVVADQIAPMVEYVYQNPSGFGGFSIVLCNVLLAYQIYCDFSGYSDIAIGAAQVMGVKLMENFRRPFFAQSLVELWSRWHISLTSWFRDYLFFPLMRNKKPKIPWQLSMVIIYVVSGLWHGANWTFILWGLVTALLIVSSRMLPKTKAKFHWLTGLQRWPKLDKLVQMAFTLLLFSLLGILFRSSTLTAAIDMYTQLGSGWASAFSSILNNTNDERANVLYLGYGMFEFLATLVAIVLMEVVHYHQEKYGSVRALWAKQPFAIRWTGYLGITICIILFAYDRQAPFYYFQF
jgi:alginate O-acetyltransferase complex protein AlgI